MYRPLHSLEIEQLKGQGCCAENWNLIEVDEDFSADSIRNVEFGKQIRIGKSVVIKNANIKDCYIGNNCTISNIGQYISHCKIEEDCFIENIGIIDCSENSSFGIGVEVNVLNENGGRRVPIFEGLSAQTAHRLVFHTEKRDKLLEELSDKIKTYPVFGNIEQGVRITNTKEIINTCIRANTSIRGVELIDNCTISTNNIIGNGVILKNSITAPNVYITDSSIVERCFIGEATKIEKGFTALDCLIFSNCELACGEAVSVFAGPYTVSHHKSTLLIACATSFSNFGSGTNMSNHAYKLGAIHQSVFERGCKFASNSYMLSPSHIGAYSLIIGSHKTNPDTHELPFSYLIENQGRTQLIPGINIFRIGTLRDIQKWQKRDKRNRKEHLDGITFGLFNPVIINQITKAIDILEELERKEPEATTYHYNSCIINKNALKKGITYYKEALTVCLGDFILDSLDKQDLQYDSIDLDWIDCGGLTIPKTAIEDRHLLSHYEQSEQSLLKFIALNFSKELAEREFIIAKYISILEKIKKRLLLEASSEFWGTSQIGYGIDYEENRSDDFSRVVGTLEDNSFIKELQAELDRKIKEAHFLIQ